MIEDTLFSCLGNTIDLVANGADQYDWSPGNLNGSTVQVSPDSNTIYTLIGSMNIGTCNDTATVEVLLDGVVATASSDTICADVGIELTAIGANTYNWLPGNLSGPTQMVAPSTSTAYIVEGLTDNGCLSRDTIDIFVSTEVLELESSPDTTVLTHTHVNLTTAGATSLLWSNGSTANFIEPMITQDTFFIVSGTNQHGCSDSDTIYVNLDVVPQVNGTMVIQKLSLIHI